MCRFQEQEGGVILDTTTGLEWLVGPNRTTTYNEAVAWVESRAPWGGNWRMPTREELKTLYQPGIVTRHINPSFKTTGWWVWAEHRDDSSAWAFDFYYGNEDYIPRTHSVYTRVFAVRSGR